MHFSGLCGVLCICINKATKIKFGKITTRPVITTILQKDNTLGNFFFLAAYIAPFNTMKASLQEGNFPVNSSWMLPTPVSEVDEFLAIDSYFQVQGGNQG